jgi:hypothetical protein
MFDFGTGLKNKRGERGSVVAAAVFGIIAMTGSAGLAVDIGRAELAQAKLSSALDAAGLAAGSTLQTTDLHDEVMKYLNVNFNDYLDSTITDVEISVDSTNSIITLEAYGTIDTTFMRYFGFETIPIGATSEITRATSGLELVMVLDNTGSMAGSSLTSLKDAASELVDILFGSAPPVDQDQKLWIGLVPFSQAVNVGNSHTDWLTSNSISSKNWGTTSWSGCVDARLIGEDITDTPPSSKKFEAYYWPDDSYNDWITTTTKNGKTTTTYTINSTKGPNKYCPQAVKRLSDDQSSILASINGMVAVGNTHVSEGAVWGWRMLSPRWRGAWGGDMDSNSLPLDYNTPKMNKAAIIMTDGENTIDNSNRGAYWYLKDGRTGSTNATTAVTRLNQKLTSVCTAMKNNNIIVYTIGFRNPGSNIESLLKSCATQPDFYFDSPTSDELHKAFRMIGDSLSSLRVSK